jgi:hypothetical protein
MIETGVQISELDSDELAAVVGGEDQCGPGSLTVEYTVTEGRISLTKVDG